MKWYARGIQWVYFIVLIVNTYEMIKLTFMFLLWDVFCWGPIEGICTFSPFQFFFILSFDSDFSFNHVNCKHETYNEFSSIASSLLFSIFGIIRIWTPNISRNTILTVRKSGVPITKISFDCKSQSGKTWLNYARDSKVLSGIIYGDIRRAVGNVSRKKAKA